jgi:hypothetical protein
LPKRYVFADEAGNFDFTRRVGASRYFVLTTLTADDCSVGDALMRLRREIFLDGGDVGEAFHATTDRQVVRDRVFAELAKHAFRIDATIFEKPKAQPHLRVTDERFYKYAWYLHFKHVAPEVLSKGDEVLIVGASLGTAKRRAVFRGAIEDVASQVLPRGVRARVASWGASADPCLQAADYCCWAIQRKWERGDPRSHVLIAPQVRTEFDVWEIGRTFYY